MSIAVILIIFGITSYILLASLLCIFEKFYPKPIITIIYIAHYSLCFASGYLLHRLYLLMR